MGGPRRRRDPLLPLRGPLACLLSLLLAAVPAAAQPFDPPPPPDPPALDPGTAADEPAAEPEDPDDPDENPGLAPPPDLPLLPGEDGFEDEPFEGSVVERDGPPPGQEPEPDPSEPDETDDEQHVVRYYLERFDIIGSSSTQPETVLRFLQLEEGETFRADDPRIDQSRASLLASGFFEEVRFSLKRGSQRGWVVFEIHVRERWTLLIENYAIGLTRVTPFGGLGLTEMNLFGTGSQLSAAFAAAEDQQAYRLRFLDPAFLGSDWSLLISGLVSGAEDYLGFTGVRSVRADGSLETDHATVNYWRAGGLFGTGGRLTERLRIDVAYRFEWIDADLPVAATHLRGAPGAQVHSPIALDLLPGQSLLSVLAVGFTYDSRDDPFLPTAGNLLRIGVDLSHDVMGSDYAYAKFMVDHAVHFDLPWDNTLTLRTFAGLILGSAPLYEQFFVGDLSDLIPSRVLDLNFHDRPTLNLLGTSIVEMQYEDLALRFGIEYAVPLYRSRSGFLYGIDLYFSIGLYMLASLSDIALQLPGYGDASSFPVDLTADVGLRFDTMIGLLHFGLADVMAFIPWGEV